MKLVLLGPPGAGKGTQAKKLERELKIKHISTGDIFRDAMGQNTRLGAKAKEYINKGLLVPDDIVVAIVQERLNQTDCSQGFILDGFPRTVKQADALSKITTIDYVVNIEVPEQELVERITGRRVCARCGAAFHIDFNPPLKAGVCDICNSRLYQREDDNIKTVKKRLQVYANQTAPLIEYYQDEGILLNIDGKSGIDSVFKELVQFLGGKQSNDYN
ncbi:MAG: adenylate kinase [Clostridia bacterium]|nr:adenylate kinase [Clostridia bacterium]